MASKPKPKAVKASQVTLAALMTPAEQNFKGHVFGGVILKMIDQIAYICARKHSRRYCVTASIDRVDFKEPIKVGELVTVVASLNYAGHTSMEVGVKVFAECLNTGKIRHTNTSYVVMVAVDDDGNPVEVPSVVPHSPQEKRRYKAAKKRYLARKKKK